MNATETSPRGPRRPSFLRRWRVAGLVAVAAGALALGACSYGGHRGWHDGPMSGQMDPERAARFAERMADRVVSAIDGTPEQKQRIQGIAQAAMTDLVPLREQARAARRDGIALLSAATIDRGAIEALRAKQMGLADGASKRLAQAMADTAEVLTPEQRTKLAERMQNRAGRWS
ncbi:MAG: Spy/CpxP family protein refolding chaperone [Burkholderiaceae bacterium]|nr:Spy/CpxP family protein refolding chaperone [Burkholderiales bacterium]MCZ8099577.1 Spy/CpxP family protein refolding chaperone [Burkholderiales bacterium]MCZ8339340.1 Spy/CpxP family protein refolding chaperone [Burkholderiaceae bacterium]